MDYLDKPQATYAAKAEKPAVEIGSKGGLEMLAGSATKLNEGQNLNYSIDGCECPCPCPCITRIEGTVIKASVFLPIFTGVSVL
jgi:hypothetical protein